MIERYSTKEMLKIWSEKEKYKRWLLVERMVNDVLQEEGVIPKNNISGVLESCNLDEVVKKSKEIEKDVGHDIVAFLFYLERLCGQQGRFVHYGLTSSDVKDSVDMIAIRESLRVVCGEISSLIETIRQLAIKLSKRGVSIMGRTHGQLAEKMPLSSVFEIFLHTLRGHKADMVRLIDSKCVGKFSGAVGDNKYIPKSAERKILKSLNLLYCEVSSQIIERENHAQIMSCLALVACTLEKMALQVRLYQQSGIEEMFEPFGKKQAGSSAMPHKRNSILSENVCGLARLLRGYSVSVMENVALWGQRDMTHSSVERVVFPDAFNVLHFMIRRVNYIFSNLEMDYKQIAKHLVDENSQEKMLGYINGGMSREEAYRKIQEEIR